MQKKLFKNIILTSLLGFGSLVFLPNTTNNQTNSLNLSFKESKQTITNQTKAQNINIQFYYLNDVDYNKLNRKYRMNVSFIDGSQHDFIFQIQYNENRQLVISMSSEIQITADEYQQNYVTNLLEINNLIENELNKILSEEFNFNYYSYSWNVEKLSINLKGIDFKSAIGKDQQNILINYNVIEYEQKVETLNETIGIDLVLGLGITAGLLGFYSILVTVIIVHGIIEEKKEKSKLQESNQKFKG